MEAMKNKSNDKQMKEKKTGKVHKSVRQKLAQQRRAAEANARRKVAKRWAELANGSRYKRVAAMASCARLTRQMEVELFDGIFLNLRGDKKERSYSSQKRVLRRIVEKRQAQAIRRKMGRTSNRLVSHLLLYCKGKSMDALMRYQFCG